ncbi:hypothetical protein DEU56DRAFT_791715, partial [Suillus clintonianus]|uniref:uncharacterized protein n=1 Tax=Suillus clintonianus TaxID=1904413 RepID=UPI001B87C580
MSPQTTHPALLTRNIILVLAKSRFAPYHNPFHTRLDILSLLALLAFYCPPGMTQLPPLPATRLIFWNEYSALAARTVLSIHRSSCTILYFTTSFILPSASLGMCGGSYYLIPSCPSYDSSFGRCDGLTACTTSLIFDIRAIQLLFVLNFSFSEYCGSIYHYFSLASPS